MESSAATFNPVEEGFAFRLKQGVTLFVSIAPVVVALAMAWWGVPFKFTWLAAGVAVAMHTVCGLGITVGFHRHQTHGSFKSGKLVETALACMGSLAIEGKIITWVADHRQHHKHTDVKGDPHSPHVNPDGLALGMLHGLYHAHMGWLPGVSKADPEKYVPKMLENKAIVWVDRLFPVFVVAAYAIPFAIGWVVTGNLHEAIGVMFWAGFMRMAFTHHVTWSINSVCHTIGKRPFERRITDLSTNVWWLALLTFGESFHHNHHVFPSSAYHGIRPWERWLDPSGWTIRLMEKLGWVWDVKYPEREKWEAKLAHHST